MVEGVGVHRPMRAEITWVRRGSERCSLVDAVPGPGGVVPKEPAHMFGWRLTLRRNPVPLLGMRCFIDTSRGWLLASWLPVSEVGYWQVVGPTRQELIPGSVVGEWWGPVHLPDTSARPAVHDALDLEVSG